MTTRRLCPALALTCSLCLSQAILADTRGAVNLFLGQKSLDLEDTSPAAQDAEDGTELGVALSFGDVEWPVMIAVDVLTSSGDASAGLGTYSFTYAGYSFNYVYTEKLDVDTLEVDLGARKFWREDKKFVPYVGGGLGLIHLEVNDRIQTNSTITGPLIIVVNQEAAEVLNGETTELGYWADAGLAWHLTPKFSVGVDARYSDAQAKLTTGQFVFNQLGIVGEQEIEAGGFHVGITAGYRWGPGKAPEPTTPEPTPAAAEPEPSEPEPSEPEPSEPERMGSGTD